MYKIVFFNIMSKNYAKNSTSRIVDNVLINEMRYCKFTLNKTQD